MSWHEFIFEDQGHDRTVVFLSGWATDWRIFGSINLNCNRIMPKRVSALHLVDELALYLKQLDVGPVTLLGWSMGGFAAADFASAYPDLVDILVLVSVRRRYPEHEIRERRESLEEDRKSCLTKFYRQCFLPSQKAAFRCFRSELMNDYLKEMDSKFLLEGLDYLLTARIIPEKLSSGRTIIVHGARDVIAPEGEARLLAEGADGAEFKSIPHGAHAVYLEKDFESIIENA